MPLLGPLLDLPLPDNEFTAGLETQAPPLGTRGFVAGLPQAARRRPRKTGGGIL